MKSCTSSSRRIQQRCIDCLLELDMKVDTQLTHVDVVGQTTRVVITLLDIPESNEERVLLQSAAHSVLVDELGRIGISDPIVMVHSSPAAQEDAAFFFEQGSAQDWIRVQVDSVHEFAKVCATTFVKAALERVIVSFPWRDVAAMTARVPTVCALHSLEVQSGYSGTVMQGNVDLLLPPLESLLLEFDRSIVFLDVTILLGRSATTLLEVYETIFFAVTRGCPHRAPTRLLFDRLFVV